MGLPGKPAGIDGNEVERYFLEGRIEGDRRLLRGGRRQHLSGLVEVRAISRVTKRERAPGSERCLADFIGGVLTPRYICTV